MMIKQNACLHAAESMAFLIKTWINAVKLTIILNLY